MMHCTRLFTPGFDHFRRDIFVVANCFVATCSAIGATFSTAAASPICVVGAGAITAVIVDGFLNDLFFDFRITGRARGRHATD